MRGFLLNFGVYYATRAAIRLPFAVSRRCCCRLLSLTPMQWSPAIAFITCFVTLFATVIAITKARPPFSSTFAAGLTRACRCSGLA